MKEKSNIEEGFLFVMQKKSESRKRTHRHQKAQSPQILHAIEEESAPW